MVKVPVDSIMDKIIHGEKNVPAPSMQLSGIGNKARIEKRCGRRLRSFVFRKIEEMIMCRYLSRFLA